MGGGGFIIYLFTCESQRQSVWLEKCMRDSYFALTGKKEPGEDIEEGVRKKKSTTTSMLKIPRGMRCAHIHRNSLPLICSPSLPFSRTLPTHSARCHARSANAQRRWKNAHTNTTRTQHKAHSLFLFPPLLHRRRHCLQKRCAASPFIGPWWWIMTWHILWSARCFAWAWWGQTGVRGVQ